jgi:hypothetical protein
MKEFSKILAASIVSSLICCLLFWLLIENKKVSKAGFELITKHTEYVKDTNTYKGLVNNYYSNTHPVEIVKVPVPLAVDTGAILSAYFAKHIYLRSFEDSLVSWNLLDTVSKNAFSTNSLWTYKIKRPQTIITNNYSAKPNKFFYLGIRTNYATALKQIDFTPAAGLALKNNWLFDLGYNFGDKKVSAGAYYKINGK